MKTQKQVVDYIKSLEGKGWDWDNAYGWQCFDTANYHANFAMGMSLAGEGAKDIPYKNDFTGKADLYNNTPEFLAQPGDIVVWTSPTFGGGYGHVASVISATLNTITVIEQNWLGGGRYMTEVATKRSHSYDPSMVFIRPKYAKSSTVTESKPTTVKPVTKPKAPATVNSSSGTKAIVKGKVPPKTLANSKDAYFRAKADKYGVNICKLQNGKYYPTGEVYQAGYDQFYIFEVKNGWARVYSNGNNGWVWFERLRVVEIFKNKTVAKAKATVAKAKKKVTPKKKSPAPKLKLAIGKKVPKGTIKVQKKPILQAKADSAGVTITTRNGTLKNEKYKPGQIFYVYEVTKDGYCRVYSPDNNGYVWHERLIITKVY
ncbi:N-acetylmuramoyl-L-alanine amidase [Mammaliicoccus phage vB_MscM-PMS3]|nr:N-acetylmuramoyl-L-alanine amidase [Mammaliicoccus phage vB_MscM-PMS3]